MEKTIIYNLRKYKLCYVSERNIEVVSKPGEGSGSAKGLEDKVEAVYYQDPFKGWVVVKNPQVAFEIADFTGAKLSKEYVLELNPSTEFFDRRKKKERNKEKRSGNKSKNRKNK